MKCRLAKRHVRELLVSCAMLACALALPPSASAGFKIGQCSGAMITGQGGGMQKFPQVFLWKPEFNVVGPNLDRCPGSPGVEYVESDEDDSDAALESWGVRGGATNFASSNAFLTTASPPSTSAIDEIEDHGARGTVRTIPVLQAAIAVAVHLPVGCTATSTAAPGRLVLSNSTLKKIFRGVITNWTSIKDGGDAFFGASCAAEFHRVVRTKDSDETAIVKKYLWQIYGKPTICGHTWRRSAEEVPNTCWPGPPVIRGMKATGVVEMLEKEPSTIGAVFLGQLREAGGFVPPASGAGTEKFWVEIQNTNGATYADPSTDGDAQAPANSNCTGVVYKNDKAKHLPGAAAPWDAVSATKTNHAGGYSLCGLSYMMALSEYAPYPSTHEVEARTVYDYLQYVIDAEPEGGQEFLGAAGTDYAPLAWAPELQAAAEARAEEVSF